MLVLACVLLCCSSCLHTLVEGRLLRHTQAAAHDANSGSSVSVLLVTFPYPGHLIPMAALGEELVRRGHNVSLCTTVMHMDGEHNVQSKVAERSGLNHLSAGGDFLNEDEGYQLMKKIQKVSELERFLVFNKIFQQFNIRIGRLLDSSIVREFDIMVVDELMASFMSCINQKWQIPMISLLATLSLNPSHLPPWPYPVICSEFSDNLTFMQRLSVTIMRPSLSILNQLAITARYSPEVTCSTSWNYMLPASGHYVPEIVVTVIGFEYPRLRSSLTTYVGPILTKSPGPLPDSLQSWLSSKAKNSVIYIGMGSTAYLPHETVQVLVNGIMSTNYSAVWSLKEDSLYALESLHIDRSRMFTSKWLPQMTVLQHSAVGLAILHGGLGSLQEAFTNGVPVLTLPFTAEQRESSARVPHNGLGISLNPTELTAVKVVESLKQIDSEMYREAVRKLQKIYALAGGAERAADLVEFYEEVGYDHLVPAYAKYEWSWVQYYNVDVYALIICTALLCIYCTVWICGCVCNRCIGSMLSKEKKE